VWRRSREWFSVGTLTGALSVASIAAIFSLVAGLAPLSIRLAVVLVASFALLGPALINRTWVPWERARVIPQPIVYRGDPTAAFQFGFELGTGLRTHLPSALPHAMWLAAICLGGPINCGAVGLGFGLSRALMPLFRNASPDPSSWDERFHTGRIRIDQILAVGGLVCAVRVLSGMM
jgi:hypothetical protein